MRAGNALHRIKFYAKIISRDAYGSSIDTYPIATVSTRGEVRYVGGNKGLSNEERFYSKSMDLIVRYQSDIVDTMRVQIDDTNDLYEITYIEVLGRKESLRLSLEKLNDGLSGILVEPPTALAATLDIETNINLTWTNNSNGDAVVIERSIDGINYTIIYRTAINTTTYSDINLLESTRYFYRIRAFNYSNYSAYTTIDDATTSIYIIPDVPTGLAFTVVSDVIIQLDWDNMGSDSYQLVASTDGINYIQIGGNLITNTYQHTIVAGTNYFYKVRSVRTTPLIYSNYSTVIQSTFWTPNYTLDYSSRSGLSLLETESGSNLDAVIMPSVGLFKPTDYLYYQVANFESADSSGYIEARFFLDGTSDIFMLFSSADEGTGGSDRYFYVYTYQNYIYLEMRSNVGTIFRNVCKSTAALSNGWNIIRWTSTGSAYTLTANGQSATFGVTGTNQGDNGRWLNLITLRDNIGIGYAKKLGTEYKPVSSGNMIDYVDYNNEHKWIVTGMGNRVFDLIGTTHLTWTGTSHQGYNSTASTLLLDSGYSLWKKYGVIDEYIPYKSGSPFDVSATLVGYTKISDHAGSANTFNLAPSLVGFNPSGSADSRLAIFDRSNTTIHTDYSRASAYYSATSLITKCQYHSSELANPTIYMQLFMNGYRGTYMSKITTTVTGGNYYPLSITNVYINAVDIKGIGQATAMEYMDSDVFAANPIIYDTDGYVLTLLSDIKHFGASTTATPEDNFSAMQRAALYSYNGTITFGDTDELYVISQPVYFTSNKNYVIDSEIQIMDGLTDEVLEDIPLNATTLRVANPSKFVVGQYMSATDDNYTMEGEGVMTVRDLRYAWGGKITDITGDVITLEGACPWPLTLVNNLTCGHSQGCIILDGCVNVNISGSGIINGNRYNQIAVLPSLTNDLLGYWENQRCAMGLAIFQCENVTVSDITILRGLVHGLAVSARSSGWSKNITLDNVKANASHDKNILVRFTDGILIDDCSADGNPDSLVSPETWEDGLIFYSDDKNCEVNRFVARNNKRFGFAWNSNTSQTLVADDISTYNNGTRTGSGFEINSKQAILSNIHVYDDMRIGASYTTADITATNVTITSSGGYDNNLRIGNCDRVTLNNLNIINSQSDLYAISIGGTVSAIELNDSSVSNHTGAIVSQASYDLATWNNCSGIIIS